MGVLTDRYGGRLIFSVLLAVSALPAVLFGYADSYWALIGVGFLLGIAGASFAVGVPFVVGLVLARAAGLRARRLRDREHRHRDRVLRRAARSSTTGAGPRSAG